ncbi:MAG TPA: winged helix-turn-helix domain-containing protein [Clostridia bacterium]|nr:winged helix-turn-helix domain-containing protein [Clostridia bacterium]
MDRPNPVRFRFGSFEADLSTGELYENAAKIPMQEKPFLLLATLLQGQGSVVTREEISKRLWPNTHVQVDQGLNAAIRKVRFALHDDANAPHFIETLGSRGYRFIHPFEVLRWSSGGPSTSGRGGEIRIAVLPLANTSELEDSVISRLMTELTAQLGRLHPLVQVIASESVPGYWGIQKSIEQIRRELRVEYVLVGNICKAAVGNQVRITTMLLQSGDRSCAWAETYERGPEQVCSSPEEIANHVARSLKNRLLSPAANEARPSKPTFAVYESYLRGRYFWNKRTPRDIAKSIEHFEAAIAQDSECSLAYAGLADAYNSLGVLNVMVPRDAFKRAEAASKRALQLEPNLAEAYVALGLSELALDRDFRAAEAAFARALALDPNYGYGHAAQAYLLLAQSRLEAAIAVMVQAHELDPLSLLINALLAQMYFYARRYDDAVVQSQHTLELDPHFPPARTCMALAYLASGDFSKAVKEAEEAVDAAAGAPMLLGELAHARAVSGDREHARRLVMEICDIHQSAVPSYHIGLTELALGETEEAMRWIERAWDERTQLVLFLNVDPRVEALRGNPRFEKLLHAETEHSKA